MGNKVNESPTITVQGQQVAAVDKFVYLGSLIYSSTQAPPTSYVAVYHPCSLDNDFWKSRISISTKMKLYNNCILPIFLYGSECWEITKLDAHRIDAVDQWCSRTLLGIKWHEFVHNEEVRRISMQPNFTAIIQSLPHSIFGHIARRDDDADAKMMLTVPPAETTRATLYHVAEQHPARSDSPQPHTE